MPMLRGDAFSAGSASDITWIFDLAGEGGSWSEVREADRYTRTSSLDYQDLEYDHTSSLLFT